MRMRQYGACRHDPNARRMACRSRLARRVMECDGAEHEIDFWLSMLAINIPNERVSDLIFWPNEYFNDINYSQRLSPEQVIEIALNDRDAVL